MVAIREERTEDIEAVREVNRRAFGQEDEGRIVDALRVNGGALLSLVAIEHDRVVGHIMYSPVRVGTVTGAALGPMAVAPDRQRRGIGGQLIQAGNQKLSAQGCPFVLVVGHPEYYPRFGFTPAKEYGISCPWPVPDPAFIVLVLDAKKMDGVSGVAVYRPEFSLAP